MKQINLHTIRTDGGTQSRISLNQDVVNEYAELMQEGIKFPPLEVYHDGSDYWLVDGFHRYFAHKKIGSSLVEIEVTAGTLREAQLKSKAVNHDHGLRRTNADIHKAIKDMLLDKEWSQWSYAEIAKWIGTSKATVGRIKLQMDEENPEAKKEETTKKYMRDGVEIETPTARSSQSRKPAERPVGTKPDSSTIDENKIENQMLNDQVHELSEVISSLSDENARLKDVIAVAQWDAPDIEKMDIEDTVKDLREQVRLLEIEVKALTDSRDSYQNKVTELIRANKSLQTRLKKYESA